MRSETKQHGEERVQRRMPRLGRAGGEPDRRDVPETEEPRDRYPSSMLKPHISSSCRELPNVTNELRASARLFAKLIATAFASCLGSEKPALPENRGRQMSGC